MYHYFLKAFVCLLVSSGLVAAEGIKPYDDAEFTQLKSSGAAVGLDFHASWCPTCRKQEKLLKELLSQEEFSGITIFQVDYDNAGDLKKEHKAFRQSTLIMFKDGKEVDRLVGDSSEVRLKLYLNQGK